MVVEPSKVGVRKCVQCGWLFISQDVERIRRCPDCKNNDDYMPRTANGLNDAARSAKTDT
jgi:predicted Zn-ribbon and HTH transcriptional regulator